jgi:hypothetical protein
MKNRRPSWAWHGRLAAERCPETRHSGARAGGWLLPVNRMRLVRGAMEWCDRPDHPIPATISSLPHAGPMDTLRYLPNGPLSYEAPARHTTPRITGCEQLPFQPLG